MAKMHSFLAVISEAILEDLGKAQDFTACTTIAEADQLYKDNEGIVTLPVDMIKKDDGDISVKPNPGEGENKPSTGGDGTGTGTEGETKPELDTYVSGIQDYEIKVGEDIDNHPFHIMQSIFHPLNLTLLRSTIQQLVHIQFHI